HVFRAQRAVLLEVTFVDRAIELEYAIRAAERVEQGPVVDMLDGVVGTVVRAPAWKAEQVVARVEILRVKGVAGLGVKVQQLTLQKCPLRRAHRRRGFEQRAIGGMRPRGSNASAPAAPMKPRRLMWPNPETPS